MSSVVEVTAAATVARYTFTWKMFSCSNRGLEGQGQQEPGEQLHPGTMAADALHSLHHAALMQ